MESFLGISKTVNISLHKRLFEKSGAFFSSWRMTKKKIGRRSWSKRIHSRWYFCFHSFFFILSSFGIGYFESASLHALCSFFFQSLCHKETHSPWWNSISDFWILSNQLLVLCGQQHPQSGWMKFVNFLFFFHKSLCEGLVKLKLLWFLVNCLVCVVVLLFFITLIISCHLSFFPECKRKVCISMRVCLWRSWSWTDHIFLNLMLINFFEHFYRFSFFLWNFLSFSFLIFTLVWQVMIEAPESTKRFHYLMRDFCILFLRWEVFPTFPLLFSLLFFLNSHSLVLGKNPTNPRRRSGFPFLFWSFFCLYKT